MIPIGYLDSNGLSYLLGKMKDGFVQKHLAEKTYENVVCTANNDAQGHLYFLRVLPEAYGTAWTVRIRAHATIAGVSVANGSGEQTSEFYFVGRNSTYLAYRTWNDIANTSYRPFYQFAVYYAKEAGITAGYGHMIGLRFYSSYNPHLAANARTLDVEVLEARNCTFEWLDTPVTYANLPGTGSTNYSSRSQFDATTQGNTMSGDRNTYDRTIINNNKLAKKAVPANSIVVGDEDGYEPAAANADFDITYPILYTPNSATVNSYRSDFYYFFPSITATNHTSGLTHRANAVLYLVGTLSGNRCTLESGTLTYDEPTAEDGKVYIPVGINTNATSQSFAFFGGLPRFFAYQNGEFQPYTPPHTHAASDISSGTLDAARIPSLDASKIGSGTLAAARLPAATPTTLGGVKVGDGLEVSDGLLSTQKYLDRKTYTGVYAAAANNQNYRKWFATVTRTDATTPWRIRMRIQATTPNHPEYGYTDWDIDYWGFGNNEKAHYVKVNHGTNYALYSFGILYPYVQATGDTFNMCFTVYSNNATNADYARDVTVDLLSYEGCEIELADELLDVVCSISANNQNNGWVYRELILNSSGFQETGDANAGYVAYHLYYPYNTPLKAVVRASTVVCGDESGYQEIGAGVSFDLAYPVLYMTVAKAANAVVTDGSLHTMRYNASFANYISSNWTANGGRVFLVGTVSGNTFTCANTYITDTEPTTEDGLVYMPIATKVNASKNVQFMYTGLLFAYQNGSFGPYVPIVSMTNTEIDTILAS